MQNIFNLLFFILFLSVTGCGSPHSETDKKQILHVGLSAEYPPFEFLQQGEIVGFDVDLIKAIGKEMGMEVQIQDMAFHNLIGALQTGKIDIAISGMTITADRQKNVDFSQSYFQETIAIVYPAQAEPPKQEQFSNKKIGVQLGTTPELWLKDIAKKYPNFSIISLDTNPPLIEKLKLGNIDYVVIGKQQAIAFTHANPSLSYTLIGNINEGYGIAVPKGSIHLKSINQALNTLKTHGYLTDLEKKWIDSHDTSS